MCGRYWVHAGTGGSLFLGLSLTAFTEIYAHALDESKSVAIAALSKQLKKGE